MKIKPIRDLRDTNKLSDELHALDEPVFITKNGYEDLVIMSQEVYDDKFKSKEQVIEKENKGPKHVGNRISNLDKDSFGYVKVASAVIHTHVADVKHNLNEVKTYIDNALLEGVHLIVFGELTITGYTCGDLFLNDDLIKSNNKAIEELINYSINKNIIIVIGSPFQYLNKLFNTSITIFKGRVLSIASKKFIPTYNEFYEGRYFHTLNKPYVFVDAFNQHSIPFGENLIMVNDSYPDMKLAIEICEDLWIPNAPSTSHAMAGATIIGNLSGSNEIIGKKEYRELLVKSTSAKLICGYIYTSCGQAESTTDMVFAGHSLIGENGGILKESELFTNDLLVTEIDVNKLSLERRRMSTFPNIEDDNYCYIHFEMPLPLNRLTRLYNPHPFIPYKSGDRNERAKAILKIQVEALKSRLVSSHSKTAVIGLSGGLDSTLALIVAVEAFDALNYPRTDLTTITLPSKATSDLTHDNAFKLAKAFRTHFMEVPIQKAVDLHFKDIKHDMSKLNNAYENVQARERTQILMDYANDHGGIVIGTGDLSEECLGWSTYNGDHMSMYNPNASIPKTLVQFLVESYAYMHKECEDVLLSILDTPISPELLPNQDSKIAQKTEDIIGPYEIHDFILYHLLRHNFTYKKIFYLAKYAFKDKYSEEKIKWTLDIFMKRFYMMQFKRSCMPDGVKVGSVSVSPRADLRLPSDINGSLSFIDKDI